MYSANPRRQSGNDGTASPRSEPSTLYAGRVAGPMTRTVEDTALLMRVLSRPDARDTMSLPYQDIAWEKLERDVRGLRIGLHLDAGWGLPVDPEVRAAVEGASG